jgi:dolichol-phosphate mannosyltransferase
MNASPSRLPAGGPAPAGSPADTPTPGLPWLILPTYNEAENLAAMVEAAGAVLAEASPEGFKILVVDDGSPDGTGQIADRLAAKHDWAHVLHRTEKNGIGPAYLAGFAYALDRGAAYVFEMDCDFSHDPADLARLLEAVEGGADLALGSRYVPGGGVTDWGLLRRFISEGGSTYARLVLGLRVSDLTGGFKCFKREVLEAIHFDSVRSQGYAFQVELTYRTVQAGFNVVEVPIVFRDREHGTSKMSWRIAAEAMWLVPLLRVGRQPVAPPVRRRADVAAEAEGGAEGRFSRTA